MNIREVAALAGVSVRTLQHYDSKQLLTPSRNAQNGYRAYTDEDVTRLQQILFFKACGFTLGRIKAILDDPAYDREEALVWQRRYLLHEKARLDAMLDTLDKTLRDLQTHGKDVPDMTQADKLAGFDFTRNPYEEEARRRWGDKAVDESNAKLASKTETEQAEMAREMEDLFRELAALRTESPAAGAVQEAVGRLYRYFNDNFAHYSPQAFAGLGEMYVADERFTQSIDRLGPGLSAFLQKAMALYAQGVEL